MPFLNSACYVLAVTGYHDDGQMVQSGQAFEAAGALPALARMANNTLRMNAIVAHMRANANSGGDAPADRWKGGAVPITIYGRFNGADQSPMHFWFECNGYIIEKWTDHALQYQQASLESRRRPASIADVALDTYTVGAAVTTLSVFQAHNILQSSAELHGLLGLPTRLRGG